MENRWYDFKSERIMNEGKIVGIEELQELSAVVNYDALTCEMKKYIDEEFSFRKDDMDNDNTKITIICHNALNRDIRFFDLEVEYFESESDCDEDGSDIDIISDIVNIRLMFSEDEERRIMAFLLENTTELLKHLRIMEDGD